jgi:RNA polymerase sigma-32 factor
VWEIAVTPGRNAGRVTNPLIAEAVRHPLLAREEEAELARRAEAGDSEALCRLVGSHLRYVIKIARRYRGWGLPMNELIQEGTVGLVQAVRRFDPERGVRLSTYAMWSIRQAIQEHVLHSWSVVRLGTSNAQRMLALTLRRIADDLVGGDADVVDDRLAVLARQFNATASEVARLARRMTGRDTSLDQLTPAGVQPLDQLAGDLPSPEQVAADAGVRRVLDAALAALSPREQLVIRKRYLDDVRHTFEAIGSEMGVSKDRARQLEAKALAKLQELLRPLRSEAAI